MKNTNKKDQVSFNGEDRYVYIHISEKNAHLTLPILQPLKKKDKSAAYFRQTGLWGSGSTGKHTIQL